MAPPSLGAEQINCGPDWKDCDIGGHVVSLNTPVGDYDVAALVARLPADQQPDAIVCLVDAAWRSLPRNLKVLRCPKVLLVADTHHLQAPINGMIRYAQSEPFDRVVLLYDRHHWEFFYAAGLRQLYWFPGLTFPHGDEAVVAARAMAERVGEIAFVGQTGICHPRRTQLLSHLAAQRLPLSIRAVSQSESLRVYGRSLVGFNAALNGDLNLRVLEIMASGAMLLTDDLARDSGLGDVWKNGRELVTYRSTDELAERAAYALAHPAEARAIGEAGARWSDTHSGAGARRRAIQKLIGDGTAHPLFTLPVAGGAVSRVPAQVRHRLNAGYEYLQELHRNSERVTVSADESVPEDFVRWCATLPRVMVQRGLPPKGARIDFLAIGRKSFESPALAAAVHVWPWEWSEADRPALVRRCTSMGLMLVDAAQLIFSRQRLNTHTNQGSVALVRLDQGGYSDALFLAKAELAKNAKSVDALIVLCEIAQESSNAAMFQSMVVQLRALAPNHPRLRLIIEATRETLRTRRAHRLLGSARSLYEQKKWAEVGRLAQEVLTVDPKSGEAHFLIGVTASLENGPEPALLRLGQATRLAPGNADYWYELGALLRREGRLLDALGALLQAATLEPANFLYQLAAGEAALAAGHGALAEESLDAAELLRPGHGAVARWRESALELVRRCNYARPRDLLLSHVEVTRLQGTGVLLRRFFPDASSFVTLRSRTLYRGQVDFEGDHLSLDLPGLTETTRTALVRRLLAPYRIRRILCVPFFESDYIHALAARELTGAPLCTYVMDDQVLHTQSVAQDVAARLFAVSDLRLAISAEMIAEYAAWFGCSFGLLPPIVTDRADEVPNTWTPEAGPVRHCAMVGNVWSARQFEQFRAFTRAAALTVDWFGNADVAWLPQDRRALESDGIFCRGFLPESQLATRLAGYPFVLLPSGTLDGTEDNEWLTRLSLPSRMVFILSKTLTPMLVLGSEKTAAARFVDQFGLGTSSNYAPSEAREKIEAMTAPLHRAHLLANARRAAPGFLVPDCGEWIWRSLASRRPGPMPFDALYPAVAGSYPVATDATGGADAVTADESFSFARQLTAIVTRLADRIFLDGFLPPDEPRQRAGADLRGAVKYLHAALAVFGPLLARVLAAERLGLLVPNNRAVLVVWAELLEESGDLDEAAAKARQALSIFYDDVYTQTLFMRCVGDVNHHADASDRFCAHPFENFEIYKDGAVFACNCTQVPFPIGNAHQQDAKAIWQSPQAQAIRASILDGSFRYCSPMTCYKRFDLPKRSEHPEEFARLQQIGVSGTKGPKELNLSYDLSCNLSCPSCRNGKVMATAEERKQLDHVRDNIVLPLLEHKDAEVVYITGSGDAFGSPHFRGILKQLCDPKFEHIRITLGTNGQLITPRLWEEFKPLHPRFRDITISIDGATPESYERHRRGSTWEKLQLSMGILAAARRSGTISRLMVNMVVQQDNFREMRPLLEMCLAWAVDGVRFYRIRQWGNVVPGEFMRSDVANPMHPQHRAFLTELEQQIFAHPIVDHYDLYELIERAQLEARTRTEVRERTSAGFQQEAAELEDTGGMLCMGDRGGIRVNSSELAALPTPGFQLAISSPPTVSLPSTAQSNPVPTPL
jgi:tetratricopeptide (TPR) repeat protein/molybdenum cofactor biosynthesis enzyme MoaA